MTVTKKRIAVLTTGRQDWGILRNICKELQCNSSFELILFAGGMACSSKFGSIAKVIEADNFHITDQISWFDDNVQPIYNEAGLAFSSIGKAFEKHHPSAIVLLGDRYETLIAATTSVLLKIPIIHLHGGEETEGAFDNVFRHAITKMSHLHFVSHEIYKKRLLQMGEHPSTVYVVGAPGLDNLFRDDLASLQELESYFGLSLSQPVILVTLHPTTLNDNNDQECIEMLSAIKKTDATYIITLPNNDPGNETIRHHLENFCRNNPRAKAVTAMGERRFFGLLKIISAMVGNSSSGIIEAPALGIPVVNIGDRQKGRIRSNCIKDVSSNQEEIFHAIQWAIDPNTRKSFSKQTSLLGNECASKKIVSILKNWDIPTSIRKSFFEQNSQIENF